MSARPRIPDPAVALSREEVARERSEWKRREKRRMAAAGIDLTQFSRAEEKAAERERERAREQERRRVPRKCATCPESFVATSRHKACPACRKQAAQARWRAFRTRRPE
jgi:hypothetical protein